MQKQLTPATAIIVLVIVVIVVGAVGYTLFLRKKGGEPPPMDQAEMDSMMQQRMQIEGDQTMDPSATSGPPAGSADQSSAAAPGAGG